MDYSFVVGLAVAGVVLLVGSVFVWRARRLDRSAGLWPIGTVVQPRFNSFLGLDSRGFHRVTFTEWGDPANPHVVVCVHGLTRNSRDFDALATRLSDRCRVVCMDVAGRGTSDWLEHKGDYGFPMYLADTAALLARVIGDHRADVRIDWVGTSMGGLMGMMLAAKLRSPIHRLVVNDVGPLVPWPALMRLKNIHSGIGMQFKDLNEAEMYLRAVCLSFGPLSDEQWAHVTRHSMRQVEDIYVPAFDPGILSALRHARSGVEFDIDFLAGVDLWAIWDRIKCPTLVLRGAVSDMLLSSVGEEMKQRGPKARVVEFPGVGHAPWLMTDDQTGVVREFLLAS